VLDLFALMNAAPARAALHGLLAPPLRGIGPVRVSYVSWAASDLRPSAPQRHHPRELLATVNLEFHAALPARLDVDGTLVFYLGFWIDGAARLSGAVEGASYHFRGGTAAASGMLGAALDRAARRGLGAVALLLDPALARFAAGRAFRHVGLLPGSGGRRGRRRWGNADRQVVLSAVPS